MAHCLYVMNPCNRPTGEECGDCYRGSADSRLAEGYDSSRSGWLEKKKKIIFDQMLAVVLGSGDPVHSLVREMLLTVLGD